ncbi:MAG: tetratricopeptide repeat protein [Rhodospirillales bacterium]|nr:tetratricopeptide repeat protein [Rhodospirillales bacterium]
MADVFDEVDEEIRQQNALKLWKKFAPLIGAVAVAIVAGTAGWVMWQDHQRKRAEADALRFVTASEIATTDAERAIVELRALARDGKAGYASLARLKEAALTLDRDRAQGLALYRQIAADASVDPQLREGAVVVAALLAVDGEAASDVARSVAPLQTPAGAWRHAAREVEALAFLRAGDRAKALEIYRSLADDLSAPSGMRQRATEITAALSG